MLGWLGSVVKRAMGFARLAIAFVCAKAGMSRPARPIRRIIAFNNTQQDDQTYAEYLPTSATSEDFARYLTEWGTDGDHPVQVHYVHDGVK